MTGRTAAIATPADTRFKTIHQTGNDMGFSLISAALAAFIAAGALCGSAIAADADSSSSNAADGNTLEQVTVSANQDKSKLQVDTRQSSEIATTFSLTQTDIKGVITATPVDILRTIPGVYGGYVDGGYGANGPGLRGWSGQGDGNYIATYIDNYQRNNLSAGNSNGYNDITPLIPETIGSLDLVKGPFSIRYGGPFSFAGSLVVTTADYLPTGFSQSAGSFGETRSLATYGYQEGDLKAYSVLEAYHEDGYRQNSQDTRTNWFSKLTLPFAGGTLHTSFDLFQTNYGQPMYPALTAVLAGPATQAINPLDKGNKSQYLGTTNYVADFEGFQTNVNAYVDKQVIYRSASRDVNTNPAAAGPDLQGIEYDNRWVYGAGFDVFRPVNWGGGASAGFRFGGSVEENHVHQWRAPAYDNEPVAQPSFLDVAADEIAYWADFTEQATAAYVEAQVKPIDWLKFSVGARDDRFHYNVNDLASDGAALPVYNNAGVIVTPGVPGILKDYAYLNDQGKVSGRGGVALLPVDGLTIYANVGQGVYPDHAVTDLQSNHNLGSIGIISREGGLTYDNPNIGTHFSVDRYVTIDNGDVESVGGINVNEGKSRRSGGDTDASQVVYHDGGYSLKLAASYSWVYARLLNNADPYITGVPPWQYSYGIDFDAPVNFLKLGDEVLRWTLLHNFTGPTKVVASGTVEAPWYDRVTTRLNYEAPHWHNLEMYVGAIYYPNSVTSECCSYLTYNGSRAVAIAPRVEFEGGISLRL
jgi:outer membrane receptor protein involved in Fe transport